GSEPGRAVPEDAARNRPGEAARGDARIREARDRRHCQRDLPAVAAPHRAVPSLCQRLQGQFELLSEPGSRRHLARPVIGSGTMGKCTQMAGVLSAAIMMGTAIDAGMAAETPKRGGTLTFMIAADAPPSFDGHREHTFATVHSVAPFYSMLIRVNPENPSSTTDFVCDLCTEMPKPTNEGRTYTFTIRQGVKFHDGSPLTAEDVAA